MESICAFDSGSEERSKREVGRGERREGPQRGRGAKIVKGKPAKALWGCWGQWS